MTNRSIVIYHNARCSKSRAACDLIAANGATATIIDYLQTPPNKAELRDLLTKLGMKPEELLRRGETVFRENYAGKTLGDGFILGCQQADPQRAAHAQRPRGGQQRSSPVR